MVASTGNSHGDNHHMQLGNILNRKRLVCTYFCPVLRCNVVLTGWKSQLRGGMVVWAIVVILLTIWWGRSRWLNGTMVFVGSGILFAIKSFGFYIRVWRKLRSAEKVLSGLVGLHGIWASSDRYRYQCW